MGVCVGGRLRGRVGMCGGYSGNGRACVRVSACIGAHDVCGRVGAVCVRGAGGWRLLRWCGRGAPLGMGGRPVRAHTVRRSEFFTKTSGSLAAPFALLQLPHISLTLSSLCCGVV